MPAYVALLRAINVGGTGKLLMSDLKALCQGCGFEAVETYIASGNVVFKTEQAPDVIMASLSKQLQNHMGKPVWLTLRTTQEMTQIVGNNPFPMAEGKQLMITFLESRPPTNALDGAKGQQHEVMALGAREIYIHYPQGMGSSTLKLPASQGGTARNLNTVRTLLNKLMALD